MNCPCGSNNSYAQCCETAHKDLSKITTAEQMMRSRYSAFVLANGNYLMDSHHSSTRPIKERKSIEAWTRSVSWIRLEILNREKGGINDQRGTVTFNAYFFENGKVEVIHEKSDFVKENGLWMYLGLAE
ncbi:Sec-C motif domain protein [Arenibacter sp. N53]|uniref:YchJ family protein n=1 Tax=Arenibacter TaxID=178469 RepID=UPI000CD4586B|nr:MULTISPECIES: YchJ family metal-binding protein [Arenibacter]MCM4150131.1 Sec-C motif domain protein [Arenibacter sp. N53]